MGGCVGRVEERVRDGEGLYSAIRRITDGRVDTYGVMETGVSRAGP